MENGPFIDDFPIKTSIYKGFSMAMLNNQMVVPFFVVLKSKTSASYLMNLQLSPIEDLPAAQNNIGREPQQWSSQVEEKGCDNPKKGDSTNNKGQVHQQ